MALYMGGPMQMSCYAMVMNVCSARGSKHANIATKWHSVMNLAMKCAKNVLL